ncbi:MAG: protein-L-isoaspartate O-methyltransferase family protein [Sphingosinicella sp.]
MSEHAFNEMRRAMVASQLRTTGVNDPRVVAAMGEVPRERFVPAERRALAYADTLIPLGNGRQLNPPMALGRMLTEARLRGHEHALVIGAATGYSSAVLARLVRSVVALEERPELAGFARKALAGTAVKVIEGALVGGHARAAPYDFILVDGAVEYVPEAIVGQIAEGGECALALVDQGVTRLAIGRVVAGAFGASAFADAAAAPLPGFARPRVFQF